MKIYYAHCQNLYRTKQEERDIQILKLMGFDVINPSDEIHQKWVNDAKLQGIDSSKIMIYFTELVSQCEGLAFRSLPDGRIPAGVAKEITQMASKLGFVIELPSRLNSRMIDVDETREYLAEIGQR